MFILEASTHPRQYKYPLCLFTGLHPMEPSHTHHKILPGEVGLEKQKEISLGGRSVHCRISFLLDLCFTSLHESVSNIQMFSILASLD